MVSCRHYLITIKVILGKQISRLCSAHWKYRERFDRPFIQSDHHCSADSRDSDATFDVLERLVDTFSSTYSKSHTPRLYA